MSHAILEQPPAGHSLNMTVLSMTVSILLADRLARQAGTDLSTCGAVQGNGEVRLQHLGYPPSARQPSLLGHAWLSAAPCPTQCCGSQSACSEMRKHCQQGSDLWDPNPNMSGVLTKALGCCTNACLHCLHHCLTHVHACTLALNSIHAAFSTSVQDPGHRLGQ